MSISNRFLLLVVVVVLAVGCATVQSRLQTAKDTNTIEAYQEFLRRFPSGAEADETRRALQDLKNQLQGVKEAAQKVLPKEVSVDVTSVSRFPRKPEVCISAHLLEGHSADERSPYVRGNYGTHEKLTRLVRYRCAKIVKSVATAAKLPDASEITIQCRHGVRQFYVGVVSGDTDIAMTIYQVSMAIEEITKHDWSSVHEEDIMEYWEVDTDIIPLLHFKAVAF